MNKKRIAVLFGGCSSEYAVSLQSAASVIRNMSQDKYDILPVGITKDGTWLRYTGDIEQIPADTWHLQKEHCYPALFSPDRGRHKIIEFHDNQVIESEIDAAFPVLHGKNGEDGTVQGVLELAGIPIIGCGALASALCMDKDKAHKLVEHCGIKVPKSVVFERDFTEKEAIKNTRNLTYPLFVKPVRSGSSFGITKTLSKDQLIVALKHAFLYDSQAIVEEQISGFEVGCAVMGNGNLTIGEVDEIEAPDGFFDYTEKYTLKSSQIHMPARIDEKTVSRIKQTATAIYRILGCRVFARVDMFLNADKEIVFNEVNTIPGFTAHSRFPNMMKGIGMPFTDLIDKLIRLGLEA